MMAGVALSVATAATPTPAAMTDAVTFRAARAEFDALHTGVASLLAEAAEPLYHEAGVWMPETSEWLVTSNRLSVEAETHVKILAIHESGAVRRLRHLEDEILMGNGGTTDFHGGAYLLSQGLGDISGSIWHIDPRMERATRFGPPDGVVLNSLNDVVVHRRTGAIVFTDPAYGLEAQGFRTSYHPTKAVWAVHPSCCTCASSWTTLVKLAEDADQPNGVCLSPDEGMAYVSDVWHGKWHNHPTVKLHSTAGVGGDHSLITAYDVTIGAPAVSLAEDGGKPCQLHLTNPRVLVDLRQEAEATGYPDGIKCDEHGNLYTGCVRRRHRSARARVPPTLLSAPHPTNGSGPPPVPPCRA